MMFIIKWTAIHLIVLGWWNLKVHAGDCSDANSVTFSYDSDFVSLVETYNIDGSRPETSDKVDRFSVSDDDCSVTQIDIFADTSATPHPDLYVNGD